MIKNSSSLGLLCLLLALLTFHSEAQTPNTWTQKSNFGGPERFGAISFNIGTKGYTGIGYKSYYLKDFWEYDPSTDSWSQKADFGGTGRAFAAGFSIGTKGYVGTGLDLTTRTKDFWEYDAVTNSWCQKADFGGSDRSNAVSFSIDSKGYIGTGLINSTTRINDFWEYDPDNDSWTKKSDVPGPARASAAGFAIAHKGYVGIGNSGVMQKDFWEYSPTTDTWIQKADFAGVGRFQAVGISNWAYGYIGLGDIGGGYSNDFWEYDPRLDTWTQKATFGGEVRTLSTGFSISNKIFVGTGYDFLNAVTYVDFWEYTPSCLPLVISSEPVNQSITYGSPASFTVSSADAISFQWQEDAGSGFVDITNNGIYSNATNETLLISLPTVEMTGYKYSCVVTGNCSLTATSNGNATLSVAPTPLIITAENKEKCYDGAIYSDTYTVNYNGFVNGEDQGVLSGSLIFGGTSATGTDAGSYSIDPSGLTSTNYALNFVNGILTIKPTPEAAIISRKGDSLISSITSGNQWYQDGIEIPGSNDAIYVVTSNGTYYTVVAENGCSSVPSNSILILNVSTKDIHSELFEIYPNPGSGIFNIKAKIAGKQIYDVEIYNNLGTLCWKQNNVAIDGDNIKKVELNDSPSGLYTVVLRNKENSFVKKILITK